MHAWDSRCQENLDVTSLRPDTIPYRQNDPLQVFPSSILYLPKCMEPLPHSGAAPTSLGHCWSCCLQLWRAGTVGVSHHVWLMPGEQAQGTVLVKQEPQPPEPQL